MSKRMGSTSKRILAVILTMLLVFGMVPVSAIPTVAATETHPEAVTITVKDGDGAVVSGAEISYVIKTSADAEVKNDTVTTDAKGEAEILAKEDYAENLTVTATVTKNGYTEATVNEVIASDIANIEVELIANVITGITVTALETQCRADFTNKKARDFDAVSVQGTVEGDTVLYQLDGGEATDKVPQISEPGKYKVKVTVKRNGYVDFVKEVTAKITDIYFTAKVNTGVFSGEPQDLLKDTNYIGLKKYFGYNFKFYVGEDMTETIPQRTDVGEYEVRVVGVSYDGLSKIDQTFKTEITPAELNDGVVCITPYDKDYDGKSHPAVQVEALQGKTIKNVSYSEDGTNWSAEVPQIKNVGSYPVYVKVELDDANYVETTKKATAQIFTAERAFEFNKFTANGSSESFSPAVSITDGKVAVNYSADFSATAENKTKDEKIVYSVDSTDATISENGTFKTKVPGTYKVKAYIAATSNYHEAEIEYTITVKAKKSEADVSFIEFEDTSVAVYVLNKDNNLISDRKAKITVANDEANITYSIKGIKGDGKEYSLTCLEVDSVTGEIRVKDYNALVALLNRIDTTGVINAVVTAKKSEGTFSGVDTAAYEVQLRYLETPANPYSLSFPINKYGWINDEIVVTPAMGYTIAKGVKFGSETNTDKMYGPTTVISGGKNIETAFKNTVKFGDEGINKRTVYLCDKDGYICGPVDLKINFNGVEQDLKVDRTVPKALTIEYSEAKTIDNILKALFYQESVEITLSATDVTSGVDTLVCKYNKEEIPVENITRDGDTLTGTATISVAKGKEYDSDNVELIATDRAGNVAKKKGDETVVVDYVSPEMTVEYVNSERIVTTESTKYYYSENDPLVFRVIVDETNNFAENGKITIQKDGSDLSEEAISDAEITIKHNSPAKGEDIYTVTIPTALKDEDGKTLYDNEGVYTVTVEYADKSTNAAKGDGVDENGVFVSDEMVIDITDPEITVECGENKKHDNSNKEPCADYTVKVTVTDINFNFAGLSVVAKAEDITGKDIEVTGLDAYAKNPGNWNAVEKNGEIVPNTYVMEFTYGEGGILEDAIYNLDFTYVDYANNTVTANDNSIVLDTTAPTAPTIEYEKSLWPVVADVLTLGLAEDKIYNFYNPDVDVTFTSYDVTSGVDSFTWSYKVEKDQSSKNVESYEDRVVGGTAYVGDGTSENPADASKFVATITLPLSEADQLRGNITVKATDKHGIDSETVTDDDTVIIVDNIAPEVSVSYNGAQHDADNKHYYNTNIIGTIKVTEANFYKEDVVLSVLKDGVEVYSSSIIDWTVATVNPEKYEAGEDIYYGEFKLPAKEDHSTDGDYVVNITYTDRSTNEATPYTSDVLVIDTTKPVIDVTYENNVVVNELVDHEEHNRLYFNKAQKATIKIEEHNFVSEEVDFTVVAKDATGKEIKDASLYTIGEWSDNDDIHTIEISYPGNANYTFDVAYSDMAKNPSDEYAEDYFTVDIDETPTDFKVEYSTPVKEIILSGVTFGFYKENATVTISATDKISGVHAFEYSYIKSEGVSKVNAELLDQAISSADIELSNGDATGTAKFTIPRDAVEKNNQFNGTIAFSATDRANNTADTSGTKIEKQRTVVDNLTPRSTIMYSKPYNKEGNIDYYDGDITATITVTEANFFAKDFHIWYVKDGGKKVDIKPVWTDESVNKHVGTFKLTADGDYIIYASYTDKSGNTMETYKSNQKTIDTKINAPVITFNGVASGGGSFADEVIPGVNFEDDNYDSYQITLTRTRYDEKDVDVKDKFIGNRIAINANGGSGRFDTFEKIRENDGVYTMTVRMSDKTGHSSTSSATFVVNRYGSVYVYNDELRALIKDQHVQNVENDIVVVEYNPNKLAEGSLNVEISKDGRPVDDVISSVAPVKNNGWYEYTHTINRENFNTEGRYDIVISSTDDVGNYTENKAEKDNTLDKKFAVIKDVLSFSVDKALPSITKITFADGAKQHKGYTEITAEKTNVEFTVYDAIGIYNIEVKIDDKVVKTFKDFSDDINNFTGSFEISGSNEQQKIEIVVTDLSGRKLVTSSEDATDSVPVNFTSNVLVTTNALARFWNNQPVFWGVVGGVAGLAILIWLIVFLKKRKKKDDK